MELTSTQQGYGPARERFISKTFNHLGGAILAFFCGWHGRPAIIDHTFRNALCYQEYA